MTSHVMRYRAKDDDRIYEGGRRPSWSTNCAP
jgi:hypothetical protein